MGTNENDDLSVVYKKCICKLSHAHIKYSKCDDTHFGRINNGKTVEWAQERLWDKPIVKIDPSNGPWIAIVLESPHIHEYKILEDEPIGPAQNKTGRMLKNKLPSKLALTESLDANIMSYNVLIMNSIQFQTSLGYDTKIFRDRIWLDVWLNGGRDSFLTRLSTYNPCIIINACTIGDHSWDPFYRQKKISFEYINAICSLIEKDEGSNSLLMKQQDSCSTAIYDGKYLKGLGYTLRGFVQTAIDSLYSELKKPQLFISSHPSSVDFCKSESKLERLNPM